MKYDLEVKEKIIRTNRYTVEVDNETEGKILLLEIEDDINYANHPDDVTQVINDAGYEIIDICEGAEEVGYELQ